MIPAQTMRKRQGSQVADESVFVFKFVSEVGLRPQAWIVFAVVGESRAIEVEVTGKREIKISKCVRPARIHEGIEIFANVVVLVAADAVLPLFRRIEFERNVREKIVLARAFIAVGWDKLLPIEVEERLHATARIGMPEAQAQRGICREPRAQIGAFGRVRVLVVDALALSIELLAKEVVIEAASGAGESRESVRRGKCSTVRSQSEFRSARRPSRAEHLHHAGERIGAVEHALRAAHELDAIGADYRQHSEIERAAGFIHRYTIDDHFVVARVTTADEQRSEPSTASGNVDDRPGKIADGVGGLDRLAIRELRAVDGLDRRSGLVGG